MSLEDQVCSVELAKMLKELGVKQESLFYYKAWENPLLNILKKSDVPDDRWTIFMGNDKHGDSCEWEISAFTTAELGEMLPKGITIDDFDHYRLNIKKFHYVENQLLPLEVKPSWIINYYDNLLKEGSCGLTEVIKSLFLTSIFDKNEANARAKCLIKLIEEGFVKIEPGNKELS